MRTTIKLTGIIALAIVFGLLFIACDNGTNPDTTDTSISVTGVTLNQPSITLSEGESRTLSATVIPADATNKKVTWKSDKESIATVDGNGKVSAKTTGEATITVTTEDGKKTASCIVTVTPVPASIAVTKQPDKTTYRIGETLDLTGLELTLTYSDDTTEIITITAENISGFDNTQVGDQELTVTYGGKTTTFTVTVIVISKIEITTPMTKTTYRAGEELDLTGLAVTATYSDDSTELVTITAAHISGFDNTQAGEQELTISYDGKTAKFTVTVIVVSKIEIITPITKTDYRAGEALDLTGLVVRATYSDNSTETAPITTAHISGFDNTQVGEQELTITYSAKTAKFTVTVRPFTTIVEISEYLATLAENTADNPIILPIQFDLGNMPQTGSGWLQLLEAIAEADLFVSLELSACIMDGTAFNPDRTVETGKDKIVSIALPNTATSIAHTSGWSGSRYVGTFEYFTVLTSFSSTGLTSIGNYAFYGCTNLALTELPEGIISIGQQTFYNCTNLTLTSLPEGITEIGGGAFYNCTNLALTSLPEGITEIGSNAFERCTNLALTSLPEGITSIGGYAFQRCTNLALTSLPEGITSISSGAFGSCTNLVLTSLPEGITSINGAVFYGCTNLALTSLPEGITSIGVNAFSGCRNLALSSLPEGITEIGSNAFERCTNLALTSLPAGIISIGDTAFAGCSSLSLITFHATTPPTLGTMVFMVTWNENTILPNLRIEVPADSVAAYKAAENWSTYADRIFAIGD